MVSQGLVGERIKMIRRQRGFSQAQLAHPELSDSYVSLIESGKRTPTPAVLELLAQKLDCSLTYLMNGVTAEQMEELELGLGFARMALDNGDIAEARRRYAELLEDSNLAGLASMREDAQYGYALAAEACGDLLEAIAVLKVLYEQSTEGRTAARRVAIAIALCRCYREYGDLQTAVKVGEEALGIASSSPAWDDDLVELGSTLLSVYIVRADFLCARQFSKELLAAADALGTPRSIVAASWNAAVAAHEVGFDEEATSLLERALALHSENGEPRNLARLRSAHAKLLLRVAPGEVDTARNLAVRALRELKESSAGTSAIARCHLTIARAELLLDHPAEALEHALMAREIAIAGTNRTVIADAHLVLGQAYWLLRRDEEALAALGEATRSLELLPSTQATAEIWQTAAEVLGRLGGHEASTAAYHQALACVGL
ncbi:helix-turn-helix domain-containing protein [Microbispora sp. NPDC049125]|uniref:helix-turn-helix domain-containing protein n=1 Tax=Microbispora sp. NPDC049125 TaxID=3154929 RepID=UPI00346600BC